MFILYPVEGLANRMRAIDSLVRYCKKTGEKYSVRWYSDPNLLKCRWSDIFEYQKGFEETDRGYRRLQFVFKLQRHSNMFRAVMRFLKRCHIVQIFGPDDWAELRTYVSDTIVRNRSRCLLTVAQSFSVFYWPENESFHHELFILNDEMKARLQKETSRFTSPTIGVHIRRTDNKDSIAQSPTESFVTAMKEELEKDPSKKFYVCSDDDAVKSYMLDTFGKERILLPQGLLCRDSEEGVRQAVIELFALASTEKIFGSKGSSFSAMASYLKSRELRMIKK